MIERLFATMNPVQLAFHDASLMRRRPFAAPVGRRNPENDPVPATSSLYDAVGTQIPTFVPLSESDHVQRVVAESHLAV